MARKQRKRLTANQREYQKQVNRIRRNISKVRREGFAITLADFLPEKPKRITKQFLSKIKGMFQPSKIRKEATARGMKIANYDDVVLHNIMEAAGAFSHPAGAEDLLENLQNVVSSEPIDVQYTQRGKYKKRKPGAYNAAASAINHVRDALNDLISALGRGGAVDYIASHADEISRFIEMVQYSSDENEVYMAEVMIVQLFRRGETTLDELKEIDEYEELNELDYETMF